MVGIAPVGQPAPHGVDQLVVDTLAHGVPGQGFLGVLGRPGAVLLRQVVFQVGQQPVGAAVVRLPPGLFQQECPVQLHHGGVQHPLVPQHVLDALHPGVVGEGEQRVDGDAEIGGDGGQQLHVGQRRLPLPLAHRLGADV